MSISDLQIYLSRFKLEDSLLFLNRVLAVSRGMLRDPYVEAGIRELEWTPTVPPYVVHLVAKQLILAASSIGQRGLDWTSFRVALDMVVNLDDPIAHDPDFKTANPAGFLERVLSQQMPGQNRNLLQRLGLAYGLYGQDEWVRPIGEHGVRRELESVIGTPLPEFMAIGFLASCLRQGRSGGLSCAGTFSHLLFAEAFAQGVQCCVPEVWERFLERVAITPAGFRNLSTERRFAADDELFAPWEFNALFDRPIVNLGNDRFVAVDPDLVLERISRRLFYDLFDVNHVAFTTKFGGLLEDFVGDLLLRVAQDRLWGSSDWVRARADQPQYKGKLCDWICSSPSYRAFFECKSFRPSVKFLMTGHDSHVQAVASRIAGAVQQMWEHDAALATGTFGSFSPVENRVYVAVTYGQFHTANLSFVRREIDELLKDRGIVGAAYLTLSLEELDSVIRLAETIGSLEEVLFRIATHDPPSTFGPYYEDLTECAVSEVTRRRGRRILDLVRKQDDDHEMDLSLEQWRD